VTIAFKHAEDEPLNGVEVTEIAVCPYCNSKLKRIFDLLACVSALIILLPFLVVVATLVKLTSPGPVLYGHIRCRRGGKSFKCWKFRTMVMDAQACLDKILQDPIIEAEWKATQKLKRDPRITPIGGILRKLSLDELPQLWNVVVGEMSIVGPRPVTEAELSRYRGDVTYYLSVTPGLTGPWQVGGRSNTTYDERVAMDKDYVITASFWGDMSLILKTIMVLFGDRDAL
jgi:lipopolysaccharide/colanic/teichoic acid biosynthesis glycosyltransferase